MLQKQNRKNKKEVVTKQFQRDAERRGKFFRDPRRDVFLSLTEQRNIFILVFLSLAEDAAVEAKECEREELWCVYMKKASVENFAPRINNSQRHLFLFTLRKREEKKSGI